MIMQLIIKIGGTTLANKRKPLSKKIRYEVFKRDKFTCQYCGRKAPDVVLHVDHIKPVAKGGKNDIMNLITSCSDCNLGKGAREISDDSIIKKQQAQLQELADKNEQLEMMLQWRDELQQFTDREVDVVNSRISELSDWCANENGKKTIRKYLKEFTLQTVLDAVDIAFDTYYDGSEPSWRNAFYKIGGICHNKTRTDGDKLYYFNYFRKACLSEFGYYNENTLRYFVREIINNESDFEDIKIILKSSRCWTDFKHNVEGEYD